MKELFKRLVKTWPKDSTWRCILQESSEFKKPFVVLMRPGEEDWIEIGDDLANARARNIIENELIRLGRPVQVTYDAGYQNWCAYLPTAYIPHPDDPSRALNAESVTPGMIYKGAPNRTQALLTVAVEAFEAASKGEGQ